MISGYIGSDFTLLSVNKVVWLVFFFNHCHQSTFMVNLKLTLISDLFCFNIHTFDILNKFKSGAGSSVVDRSKDWCLLQKFEPQTSLTPWVLKNRCSRLLDYLGPQFKPKSKLICHSKNQKLRKTFLVFINYVYGSFHFHTD